jgi:predicted transcriptional regulator
MTTFGDSQTTLILETISEHPNIPRVELCEKHGTSAKIQLGQLLTQGLIKHDETPVRRFNLTMKGRSLVRSKGPVLTEEPASGFCKACECNPCDCNWGN